MTKLSQRRACPFCRRTITLGYCKIVGTNVERRNERRLAGPRAGAEPEVRPEAVQRQSLPSGTAILGQFGRNPVIAEAPLDQMPSGLFGRLLQFFLDEDLPPLHSVGRPEDLPARACPHCERALPADIDDRDFVTVAVIGSSHAGKTHYLASLIRDAYRMQALADYGYTEFMPDEATAFRYETDYYAPLFDENRRLDGTHEHSPNQFKPLSFRVTPGGLPPFGLLMYDVSGEILIDRHRRAALAPFVQHAAAAIYLVDPYWLPGLRGNLGERRRKGQNPADLLTACVQQMTPYDRRNVPFAITLSKSDAVCAALGDQPLLAGNAPTDPAGWAEDRKAVDERVRDIFHTTGAHDLLAAADRLGRASFHAVSPLGSAPDETGTVSPVPVRCLDPLVTVLGDLIPVRPPVAS